MTSLQRQLEALQGVAATASLSIEKKHVSLLFEKKQAEELTRETVQTIGRTGLAKLSQLDADFAKDLDGPFFTEEALQFQRALITKDENSALSSKLELLLFRLSPYLQHFACQQVLEWLVYKYQIHAFNAESFLLAALPFHDTNFFGRILSVLSIQWDTSKEWGFLKPFVKPRSPVPFATLVKSALRSTHSILSKYAQHIERLLEVVGEEYLELRCPQVFTFYAKLLLSVLDEAEEVDDSLLARILPVITQGLISSLASFRNASLMVVCQLALTTQLTPKVAGALNKILLLKLKESTLSSSLSTFCVICQHQRIETISETALLKLVRREETLGAFRYLARLGKETDLSRVVEPLTRSLLGLTKEHAGNEDEPLLVKTFERLFEEPLGRHAAGAFFSNLLQFACDGGPLPGGLSFTLRDLVIRYGEEFQLVREEWRVRDEEVLNTVIEKYQLEDLLMIEVPNPRPKRTRRRSKSQSEESGGMKEKKLRLTEEERKRERDEQTKSLVTQIQAESEFAQRRIFKGDPLKKALKWAKEDDWENVNWALEEMTTQKEYLKSKLDEDVEDLIWELVRAASQEIHITETARSALTAAELNDKLVCQLLTRADGEESKKPSAKKAREATEGGRVKEWLKSESKEEFGRRLSFVLEMLTVNERLNASSALFSALFQVVKSGNEMSAQENTKNTQQSTPYVQQLAIGVLTKILKNPGKYIVQKKDLQLDTIVEMVRESHDHRVLRDALRLLTAAVALAPSAVIAHAMSVFTFMGSGVLKRDNELTLETIEHTLAALFSAIVTDHDKKTSESTIRTRLIAATRVFAASIPDIAAHRRERVARAVASAVSANLAVDVMAVLFEGYVARWQRDSRAGTSRGSDLEAYEDVALDIATFFEPANTLSVCLGLVRFVLSLGGDSLSKGATVPARVTEAFERSKYSQPKIRHFRFILVGLIAKILSHKPLFDKLGERPDDALFEDLYSVGQELLTASVELDDFAASETKKAEAAKEAGGDEGVQTHRYWLALTARVDIISEKLRNLLPGAVSARLIAALLENPNTEVKMREKTLQLMNVKLMQDGYFYHVGGIQEAHLDNFTRILNKWLVPTNAPEEISLCQNAAFSLKLVMKRLPLSFSSTNSRESIDRCMNIVLKWESLDEMLVGNALLLAGELVRSRPAKDTLIFVAQLADVCVRVQKHCIDTYSLQKASAKAAEEEGTVGRRKRIRQASLCGRRYGIDTLLICALTCTQRILDQFLSFVAAELGPIIASWARFTTKFVETVESGSTTPSTQPSTPLAVLATTGNSTSFSSQHQMPTQRSNVQFRLLNIKKALLKLEVRLLPETMGWALKDLKGAEGPLISLFGLIAEFFTPQNRNQTAKAQAELIEPIFLEALDARARNRKPEEFEKVCRVESAIFSAFFAMADLLSENQLRPSVTRVVAWAEEGLAAEAEKEKRLRLLSLFRFCNRFYSMFNTLAIPYFGRVIEMSAGVLKSSEHDEYLLHGKKGTLEALEVDAIIGEACDLVASCARFPQFFTEERAKGLLEVLVDEVENTKVEGHEARIVSKVAPAIYRVAETHPDLFADALNRLLLKTRTSQPKVRYRVLLVLAELVDRVGDSMAPHLPLLMPFLSELLEDENHSVEEQCDKVLRLLQSKFGADIAEGFA